MLAGSHPQEGCGRQVQLRNKETGLATKPPLTGEEVTELALRGAVQLSAVLLRAFQTFLLYGCELFEAWQRVSPEARPRITCHAACKFKRMCMCAKAKELLLALLKHEPEHRLSSVLRLLVPHRACSRLQRIACPRPLCTRPG